jgi:hypothetical protein
MRYLLYIFLFLFCCTTPLFSLGQQQNIQKRSKQIEAIKIGYITRRLALTPEESQKFWPVYDQFQEEQSQLIKQKRQARIQNAENPDQLVDEDFYFETKMLELRKKYRQEFGKILSPEKVKALYIAEREFKEELIKQLKKRSEGNQ